MERFPSQSQLLSYVGSARNISILNKSFAVCSLLWNDVAINDSAPEPLDRIKHGSNWKCDAVVHPGLGKLNHFDLFFF